MTWPTGEMIAWASAASARIWMSDTASFHCSPSTGTTAGASATTTASTGQMTFSTAISTAR